MIKQNKGEWSEVYAFLKLLSDGLLYSADENLNKDFAYFPVKEIIRKEKRYVRKENCVEIFDCDKYIKSVSIEKFGEIANILLGFIKSSKGVFGAGIVEDFIEEILLEKIKAQSLEKIDMKVVLYDNKKAKDELFNFSIKSKLACPATLLNSSCATNFIYEIKGDLDKEKIDEINNIKTKHKVKDRVKKMYEKGLLLEFCDMENKTFESNLFMIDSLFPSIMAEILKLYYLNLANKIEDLAKKLDLSEKFSKQGLYLSHFEYKIKNLLMASALSMVPAKKWNGFFQATSYIVIKEDGMLLCYHAFDYNKFLNYIYKNTKLDTPSSTRFSFGKIYSKNDKNYIKLNLQIRFI